MAFVYHPKVARGGISHDVISANGDSRYVGLYHWCGYWAQWDKIIAVDGMWWTVQGVDLNGVPLPNEAGRIRKHCTAMEARHFADHPFGTLSRYDKSARQFV